MHVVFRALGPVAVECGGAPLSLRPMEQTLLAVLLARQRHWASTDELIELLWPDQPARNATNSLRVHAHRLRGQFRDMGRHRLVTESSGYRLVVEQGELDLATFESAERRAREQWPRDPAYACAIVREALELWRGDPFCDIEAGFARDAAQRLVVVREGLLSTLATWELERGNQRELRTEVDVWAAEFPWSEDFARAQVLTVYRCGDVQGAAERHRAFTRRLRAELGVDPSDSFKKLLVDVLNQAVELVSGRTPPTLATAAPRPPHGRDAEAAAVRAAIESGEDGIIAIVGPAGFGKTTLVRHLADAMPGWCLTRQSPALAWYDEVLVDRGLAPVDGSSQRAHVAIAFAVREVCREKAVRVLAIDDADALTADTAAVLAALERMPQRPALVVTSPARNRLDRLVRQGTTVSQQVTLGPLADAQARAVVTEALPIADGTGAVDAIVSSADGNPLLLNALSRHVAAGGKADEVPDSVVHFVSAIMGRLSPGGREIACLAALDLPSTIDVHLLAAAVGRPEPEVLDELERLIAGGLLVDLDEGMAFRHRTFRDAVAQVAAPARRKALHVSMVRALDAAEVHALELAHLQRLNHHLVGADRPEWGRRLARSLAREATSLGDAGRALDAGTAFDRAVDSGKRAGIEAADVLRWQLAAADQQLAAGLIRAALARAWEMAPSARAVGSEAFAQVAVLAAGPWFVQGEERTRATQLLREAMDWLPPGAVGSRARVQEALVRVHFQSRDPAAEAALRAIEEDLTRAAGESGDDATRVVAMKGLVWLRSRDPVRRPTRGELTAELVRLTATMQPGDHLTALELHLRALLDGPQIETLPWVLARYHSVASASGAIRHLWWAAMLNASVASYLDDVDALRHWAAEASRLEPAIDDDVVSQALRERDLAEALRGRGVSERLLSIQVDGPGDPDSALWWLLDEAVRCLAGKPPRADLSELEKAWRVARVGHRATISALWLSLALRGRERQPDSADLCRAALDDLLPALDGMAAGSGAGVWGANAHCIAELYDLVGDESGSARLHERGNALEAACRSNWEILRMNQPEGE